MSTALNDHVTLRDMLSMRSEGLQICESLRTIYSCVHFDIGGKISSLATAKIIASVILTYSHLLGYQIGYSAETIVKWMEDGSEIKRVEDLILTFISDIEKSLAKLDNAVSKESA